MEEPGESREIQPRLVIGLVILAFGALLALESLHVLAFNIRWHDYWPVILIVLGLSKILAPRRHGRTAGFILFFIGCWFLARNLWDYDLDRFFFPAILLAVGAALVLGSLTRRHGPWIGDGTDGSAVLHPFAVLGATRSASSSQAFQGGSATAVLGSCTVDLRDAGIAAGQEALIDAVACWGGVLILVPETWAVAIQGAPILGGFHDFTRPPAGGSTQRLVVRGVAFMGGVEVRNRSEREDPR
jgi:predicted membrane protein